MSNTEDSLIQALEDAYAELSELAPDRAANLRGFLVRVPESRFYRPPPRGAYASKPTFTEVEQALTSARLDLRRARARRNPDGLLVYALAVLHDGRLVSWKITRNRVDPRALNDKYAGPYDWQDLNVVESHHRDFGEAEDHLARYPLDENVGGALPQARESDVRQNARGLTMPREWYLPKELQGMPPNIDPQGSDVSGWTYESTAYGRPRFHALVFAAKQSKPAIHAWYSSEGSRAKGIQDLIDGRRRYTEHKQAQSAARRSFQHGVTVGDIFYTSWGYDETNTSWFQVVDIRGKHAVVREIRAQVDHADRGADYVVPTPDAFKGPPVRVLVQPGNIVKIDGHHGSRWDGEPQYQTASGWGH